MERRDLPFVRAQLGFDVHIVGAEVRGDPALKARPGGSLLPVRRGSSKTGFLTFFFTAAGATYAVLRGFQLRIRLELEDGADSVSPDDFLSEWVPPVESQWQEPLLWSSLRPGAEPQWINEYPVLAFPAPTEEQTTNEAVLRPGN